jgi:[ribosomal protein S5]-alanine N-acetyltransferase
MAFSLVPCGVDGHPASPVASVAEPIAATYAATAALYKRAGFIAPWISYIAVDYDCAVGGGAFVAPPRDGRVEIAYFTLKELEGRGYGTRTAAELLGIAHQFDPSLTVTALTLRANNASTKILRRLGFKLFGDAMDLDAGAVWEWRRAAL